MHGACEALQQTVAQLKQRLVMEASKQMDLTGLPLPNTPRLCLSASFQPLTLPFSFAGSNFAFNLLPLLLCALPSHQPLLLMTFMFCVSKIDREACQILFYFVQYLSCLRRASLVARAYQNQAHLQNHPSDLQPLLLCHRPPPPRPPPPSFVPPSILFCSLRRSPFTPTLNCFHKTLLGPQLIHNSSRLSSETTSVHALQLSYRKGAPHMRLYDSFKAEAARGSVGLNKLPYAQQQHHCSMHRQGGRLLFHSLKMNFCPCGGREAGGN